MKRITCFLTLIALLLTSTSAWAVVDSFSSPQDSYVRQSSPAMNYGSENVLIADGISQDPDNGLYGEVATLIKWDLSSIPSGSNVTAASITLDFFNSSGGTYNILQQLNAWNENSVDFTDLSTSGTIRGIIPAGSSGVVKIPLNASGIALVQGWIDGNIDNNGFAIRTSGTNDSIGMDSRESSGMAPTLEVDYEGAVLTLEELTAKVREFEELFEGITRSGSNIFITGANVHIRNGLGSTDGSDSSNPPRTNGLGNLIVGYNEPPPCPPATICLNRLGSHNVVIGPEHTYTSYGGLITGDRNRITDIYSVAVGGFLNQSTGAYSGTFSGSGNQATGNFSTVTGGASNTASGGTSHISGGRQNNATGGFSTVSGGRENTSSGNSATVGGGFQRSVNGFDDWRAGSLFETQ